MKEVDVIAIFKQREYITLEECFSALDVFSKKFEEKKNHIEHPLIKYLFKQERLKWNGWLALDKKFKAVLLKYSKEMR